jgi:predicted aspartyl protease
MLRTAILVFVTAAIGSLPARAIEPEQPVTISQPLYASPTTRDQVGRIVVPVMVNDQGPFRFVLDTGANRSVLAEHMVAKLGLTLSDATMSVELSGATGEAIVRTVAIQRLQAGAVLIENTQLPVIGATMAGIDGVLGVEGLAGKRLIIDFVRDNITIEQSDNKRASADFVTLPARLRHGQLLVVDVDVGGVKTQGVIDTGADGSLGTERLRQALRRRHEKDRPAGTARIEGATADVQTGDLVFAPQIRFKGVEITGMKIAYGNFHVFSLWNLQSQPALLVGMDILGTADILVIDYLRREVRIKPRDSLLVRLPD